MKNKNYKFLLKTFLITATLVLVFFTFKSEINAQNSDCNYSSISFWPNTNTSNLANAPTEAIITVGFNGSGCAGKKIELVVLNAQNQSVQAKDNYLIKSGDTEAKFTYNPSPNCVIYSQTNSNYCIFFALVNVIGGDQNILNTGNASIGSPGKMVYTPITTSSDYAWNFVSAAGIGTTSPQTTQNTGGATPADTLPKLDNPLCAPGSENCIESIPQFINQLVEVIILVAIPLVALAIMYAGFLLVVGAATGNSSKIDQGKKAFLYAVIGGAILLGAWVIAEVIGSTVDDIAGYN